MPLCVSGQVDGTSTCGNATLTIYNNTLNTNLAIIPRVSRMPGGACLEATGFLPSVLTAGNHLILNVPTLTATDSTTVPANAEGFFPYNPASQVSYVSVTSVILPAGTGVTSSGLTGQAGSMATYLTNAGASLETMATQTFMINTCGTDHYVVTGNESETMLITKELAVRTLAAPHPARNTDVNPTTLNVYFEDVVSGDVGAGTDDDPYDDSFDASTSEGEWIIAFIVAAVVALGLAVSTAVLFYMYKKHAPIQHHEVHAHVLKLQAQGMDTGGRSFNALGSYGTTLPSHAMGSMGIQMV